MRLILFAVFATFFFAVSAQAAAPDLVVSSMEVKSIGKEGKVLILYTIKNQGNAIAPKSATQILVQKEGKNAVVTDRVPGLLPGGSYNGQVEYTLRDQPGSNYIFKANADYKNNLFENNEMNNGNSFNFSIGRKLGK